MIKNVNQLLKYKNLQKEMSAVDKNNYIKKEEKLQLPNVTLICVDCVDITRAKKSIEQCCSKVDFGYVKLLTSIKNDLSYSIEINPIKNIYQYSQFCLAHMIDYINTDYLLICQWDGFIVNPSAWIPEFLNYDYVGAYHFKRRSRKRIINGGFCLRSKSLLYNIKKIYDGRRVKWEDAYICTSIRQLLEKEGINFAPVEIAERFSTEEIYNSQFGVHHRLFGKKLLEGYYD